ncbi:hypothetical protein DMA12_07220 [Amycolatopsis balhimycina DSM 5908]|uniref:Nudix hydrolase domain-containing protein n=2 Tax=Amycolatopsis balhimycina TaxID=208443 RepID=A0A428WYY6_AMYBA|nr:hypothetical protein DMA12_07220 [Amycolatopsis balhimycina DSM 5908]
MVSDGVDRYFLARRGPAARNEAGSWEFPGTYLARHVAGEPGIAEETKCSAIGWFRLDELPSPPSKITGANFEACRNAATRDGRT